MLRVLIAALALTVGLALGQLAMARAIYVPPPPFPVASTFLLLNGGGFILLNAGGKIACNSC